MLHWCSIRAETLTSTLLPTLCIILDITTTSCSKGLQGLRFPLGDTGIFTGKWVQKVLVGDSDHLVEPFMHVTIQMTRHYAQLVLPWVPSILLMSLLVLGLYLAIKFGLYLNNIKLFQAFSLWGFFFFKKSFLLIISPLWFSDNYSFTKIIYYKASMRCSSI